MDARMREERRLETSRKRIRPAKPQRIFFPADSLGECIEIQPDTALELYIETTRPDGTAVDWLMDEWWIRIHALCKDRNVTVVVLPTPGALLNPVILHQMDMVRRIAPRWRLIGYALSSEAGQQPDASRWINTPYDEIRFGEQEAMSSGAGNASRVQSLIERAREMPHLEGFHTARVRLTRTWPVLDDNEPAPSSNLQVPSHRTSTPSTVQST